MTAADIAHALGDARREGRTWRCRCPLHGATEPKPRRPGRPRKTDGLVAS